MPPTPTPRRRRPTTPGRAAATPAPEPAPRRREPPPELGGAEAPPTAVDGGGTRHPTVNAAAAQDPDTAQLLGELDDWVTTHGHADIPQSGRSRLELPGSRPLGRRLSYLRAKHDRGTLPDVVTRALETYPGWTWTPAADTIDRHLTAIRDHYAAGHLSRTGLPGDTLRWLVTNQQRDYRGLPPDTVTYLRGLPAPVRGHGLTRFLTAARTWLDDHPGATMTAVTSRTTTTLNGQPYQLGEAARIYRRRANGDPTRTPLTDTERTALEDLPGWTWDPRPPGRRANSPTTPEGQADTGQLDANSGP